MHPAGATIHCICEGGWLPNGGKADLAAVVLPSLSLGDDGERDPGKNKRNSDQEESAHTVTKERRRGPDPEDRLEELDTGRNAGRDGAQNGAPWTERRRSILGVFTISALQRHSQYLENASREMAK